ncbi:MAG: HD domain-containing protein [Planctomycetaceae bacterium]|jgi:guanosine-3',5'-bis(diphosphate) 3'-pyrophosphohydrolase|nr:HD domain-containing protein [Planctomycetaceae bacterium]
MFIHIEGLDLAGKSTVCRRLKERIPDAVHLHNSLVANNPIYEKADNLRKNINVPEELTGMLYYAALRAELDDYVPPPPSYSIIQDSTIVLRSVVFHTANGNTELAKRFERLLPEHPKLGASFVLTATREKRLERLKGRISRGNDAPDDFIVRDDYPRFQAMEQHLILLAKQYFNAEVIFTDNLETPNESDNILDTIINKASQITVNKFDPLRKELWQKAAGLAAKFHKEQLRKDGQTPYFSHPSRVALTLSHLFHINDPVILAAALLHDVIEDTTGDFDDIESICGTEVAILVSALTKDSRLREADRELAYQQQMEQADWRVRMIKLADIYDNIWDASQTGVKMGAKRWANWIRNTVADDERFRQPLKLLEQLLGE